MNIQSMFKYLSDIRFVIVLFFIIRMFGITNPPLEVAHNWRQTDMMMVTRNIAAGNASILYPAVDYAGSEQGTIGMEYPLFNYINAKLIQMFGYSHWYGRLLNLLVSSFGIYFFYLLVLRMSNEKIAYYSAFVLLAGLWFGYSRKIMPDSFSASLLIAGMYSLALFMKATQRYALALLLAAIVLLSLAGLTKISSFALLPLIAPLFLLESHPMRKKMTAAAAVLLSVGIGLYWYLVWVPYLNTLSSIRFFMGNPIGISWAEIVADPYGIFKRFMVTALGISGFIAVLGGCYIAIRKRQFWILLAFFFSLFAECLFILKAGNHFAIHSYYIVPFVPALALVAGYFISSIPKRYGVIVCMLIFSENIIRLYPEFIIRSKDTSIEHIGEKLDAYNVPKDAIIAVNSAGSPTVLYFTGRKGWTPTNNYYTQPELRSRLIEFETSYFLIIKKLWDGPPVTDFGASVFEDDLFVLLKVSQ